MHVALFRFTNLFTKCLVSRPVFLFALLTVFADELIVSVALSRKHLVDFANAAVVSRIVEIILVSSKDVGTARSKLLVDTEI